MSIKWGSAPVPASSQLQPSQPVRAARAKFCYQVMIGSQVHSSAPTPELTELGVVCVLSGVRVLVPWANVAAVELEG